MDEYKFHYKKSDRHIEKAIAQMNGRCVTTPKQYDGVSCGVFVCKYMYELVVRDRLVDTRRYIQGFRHVIADIIESPIEEFEEIVKREESGFYNDPAAIKQSSDLKDIKQINTKTLFPNNQHANIP